MVTNSFIVYLLLLRRNLRYSSIMNHWSWMSQGNCERLEVYWYIWNDLVLGSVHPSWPFNVPMIYFALEVLQLDALYPAGVKGVDIIVVISIIITY